MYANILNYRCFHYLKLAVILVSTTLLLYLTHSPAEPPNGGTWLGYVLGSISAMLLFFLLWFGIRKRQYNRTTDHLAGWASAHIYLGGSLMIIATLHCGFQFGLNVHTLTYGLLMIVSLSGFYGLYLYLVIPAAITKNRNGVSQRDMISRIADLDEQGLVLAASLGEEIHYLMLQAVESTRIIGSFRNNSLRFGSHQKQSAFSSLWLSRLVTFDRLAEPRLWLKSADSLVEDFLNRYITEQHDADEVKCAAELMAVFHTRQDLVARVQRDLGYHARMKSWLSLHIPCAIALLSALTVHVLSVFLYW